MHKTDFIQLRPTVMPYSSSCNLRCKHCYCGFKRNSQGNVITITDEVLESVIKKFLRAYPKFISFCWYGGEPLLGGLAFYIKALKFQEKYRKGIVENRIQTNATLIDEDTARFFKKHDFKVGVSLDGPRELNDKQRVDINGKGTFGRIMNGIDFLRKSDVEFSVIITVTQKTVKHPSDIYGFMTKQGFKTVSLNPCFRAGNLTVNPIEYAKFMNSIFNKWFKEDNANLTISFFQDILRWMLGGKPTVCHMRNSCYRHIKIDYNGDVIPCDEFLESGFKFGNIANQEIEEIINGENYKKFFSLVSTAIPECKTCKWFDLCTGGCSRYSFSGDSQKHLNTMCESKKIMFEHISKGLKEARE